MVNTISIRELRENLAQVADHIALGESFVVIRRSKPVFIINPVSGGLESQKVGQKNKLNWETLIDFTEGGKNKGISGKKLLKVFQKINR